MAEEVNDKQGAAGRLAKPDPAGYFQGESMTRRTAFTVGVQALGGLAGAVIALPAIGFAVAPLFEQEKEGEHELREKLVATPWSDDSAAHDEALVEQASSEAVPEGTKIAEVADLNFTGDARAAANDLSVADGRFGLRGCWGARLLRVRGGSEQQDQDRSSHRHHLWGVSLTVYGLARNETCSGNVGGTAFPLVTITRMGGQRSRIAARD